MGIRFLCTHCQRRLNVKAAQAGQLGQCHHCRQTVRVPMESTRAKELAQATGEGELARTSQRFQDLPNLDDDGLDDPSEILDVDEQVTMDGLIAGEHAPNKLPPKTDAARRDRFREETSGEAFLLDRPSPSTGFGTRDPIQDAPNHVWYFRSRQIGERGPLKPQEMQQCLEAGDVTIGSMVWRGDWDDWVEAETVFESLAHQAKKEKQRARLAKAIETSGYEMPEDIPEAKSFLLGAKKSKILIAISGIGLALVAVLVYVLVRILSN